MDEEGKITGFSGRFGSGLAFIHIDGLPIPIESGCGLRAICEAFGSLENAIGKGISFDVDWLGVLEGFEPIEEAI